MILAFPEKKKTFLSKNLSNLSDINNIFKKHFAFKDEKSELFTLTNSK